MLYVEVAETVPELEQGLMFRESLDDDSGMLFKFQSPRVLKFWGLNTYIPLDIAFIRDDNTIARIGRIREFSKSAISSEVNCAMAIEANDGYFVSNGIKAGDKIEISEDDRGQIVLFKKQEG